MTENNARTASDFADLDPQERLAGRLMLKSLQLIDGPDRDRRRARVAMALAWLCSMSDDKLADAHVILDPRPGDDEANRETLARAAAGI